MNGTGSFYPTKKRQWIGVGWICVCFYKTWVININWYDAFIMSCVLLLTWRWRWIRLLVGFQPLMVIIITDCKLDSVVYAGVCTIDIDMCTDIICQWALHSWNRILKYNFIGRKKKISQRSCSHCDWIFAFSSKIKFYHKWIKFLCEYIDIMETSGVVVYVTPFRWSGLMIWV